MNKEHTNHILQDAYALVANFAKATDACINIYDQDFTLIASNKENPSIEKSVCVPCIKCQKNQEAKTLSRIAYAPCREMHLNAILESHRFGGTYTYVCPLGFLFWTSPVYFNGRFIAALLGSGFLGISGDEAVSRIYRMHNGEIDKTEIENFVKNFPQANPQKIKALTELTLICAESLSVKSEGCHAAMKRRASQQHELAAKIEDLKNLHPVGSNAPEYPIEKEDELLEALKQGDVKTGKKILNEILAVLVSINSGDFKFIQYRAIELAALLSRVDAGPGFNANIMLETNNSFIKRIEETCSIEELADVLVMIIEDIGASINSFRGINHPQAIKKAEYYILENFTRKLSLEEIATASGFSSPYFSTIFKKEMGESLSSYLNRLRVEKARLMLGDTSFSLSKIARTCGFEDQSWFSKIFKLYTGTSPGKYRNRGGRHLPASRFHEKTVC